VVLGETVLDPEIATAPMPSSIVTLVTLVEDHDKVELWPKVILAGLTFISQSGSSDLGLTVTVA
jgi:hypothetical protein